MAYRYILVQIKADWAEMAQTMGFPSWASKFAPCMMCATTSDNMFNYNNISLMSDMWGERETSYEEECASCEIRVEIVSEKVRQLILIKGGLYTDPNRKAMGRLIANDVSELKLCAGDRIEPSSGLKDMYNFEFQKLPFTCVFWRERRDSRGRIASWVLRRHPIFPNNRDVAERVLAP